MGQYYRATLYAEKEMKWLSSYDTNNGAKLMEHSYIGNYYVMNAEKILFRKPMCVAWIGDYAEEEDTEDTLLKKMIKKVWNEPDVTAETPTVIRGEFGRIVDDNLYLINLSKYEKVDLYEWHTKHTEPKYGSCVHPLPLLTAVGNGRGGGDYSAESNFIGYWAGDLIVVVDYADEQRDYKSFKDITNDLDFIDC